VWAIFRNKEHSSDLMGISLLSIAELGWTDISDLAAARFDLALAAITDLFH